MSLCFGVKIILTDKDSPVTQNTDIGLYNVASDNSEFRWCQNSIGGLSTTWKPGMIVQNGLSNFTIEIDLRQGGATSYPGSGNVVINNLNNFQSYCDSQGIVFNGLKLEIWELGTGDYENRIRTYACEDPEWTQKEFTIKFKGNQENRIANIMNTVTSVQYPNASSDTMGKDIPASFGQLIPAFDAYGNMTRNTLAKFIRTDDLVVERFYNDDYFTDSGYTKTIMFPVFYTSTSRVYKVYLRSNANFSGSISPDDSYVRVVDGEGTGQIRKIEYFYADTGPTDEMHFKIIDYFETELDGTDTDRSWVQFIKVYRQYDADHAVCEGFYDNTNTKLTKGAEIYSFDNNTNKFSRMAPFGYNFKDAGDANNKLIIDPKLFDGEDINSQNSFLILPVVDPHFATDDTLENWENSDDSGMSPTWTKFHKNIDYVASGFYWDSDVGSPYPSFDNLDFSNTSNCVDKDSTTYATLQMRCTSEGSARHFAKVIYFDLPELPLDFEFSNCYIGVKLASNSGANGTPGSSIVWNSDSPIRVMLRRFKYGVKRCLMQLANEAANPDGCTVNDMPDFYFVDNPETNNHDFFVNDTTETSLSGYATIFDTGITSKDDYESYVQGGIFFKRYTVITSYDITHIHELAFIFKKSNDIGSEIYSPIHGRVFAYTWDGRKTTTNVIEKPNDVLEHICRLQNYSDTCPTPISNWGLQYANEPLIGTSDYGSFDDPDLIAARDYCAAAQITNKNDGYTDVLKQKACNDFCIANWQDNNNYERIIALPTTKLTPVYTVQMQDILDRSKIKVIELDDNKIVAEPIVKYNKHPATDDFDSIIQIKNSSASSYTTSFVDGINNATDAETLWNSCHSLYLKCNRLNKLSDDKSELTFANGPGGYTIALRYLQTWVNWQFCNEIEFPLHYNVCASWQECTPINILFSHQTQNISKAALVERVEINPNPPYDAMIRAIMYA